MVTKSKDTMQLNEFLDQSKEIVTTVKIAIYSFFAYLGIDTNVVEVLFILMSLDTALGIGKAVRLGYSFSFKKLLWGMITKLSVLLIPMVIALVAKGLSFDFKWFVYAVLNILIVAEGFSAMTNILSIKTKKNVENVDFITVLLKSIRKGMYGLIQKYLRAIETGENPDKNIEEDVYMEENIRMEESLEEDSNENYNGGPKEGPDQ